MMNEKVSQDKAVQPVKPVPAALSQPLSVNQPTSSGGTSCEPTSPPHQTSTTPDMSSALAEVGSPSQPADEPVHHERYDKAQAGAKREELRDCFTSQAVRLKDHLKAKYTDEKLPDFLNVFILNLPSAVKDEHKKFFHSTSSEISGSKTFDEFFIHLDVYWDYLNYSLLEGVIEAHGTEKMRQEMESYVRDLEEFRRKTKLFVYWQVERHKKGRTPPPGYSQFVTKHCITGESTLEDVEKIRREITREFHLSTFALLLIDVVECCVLITWFVPSSIISRLQERLGSLTGLHIEDVFYDSSDVPQVPPNPQDSGSLSSPHSPEGKPTPSSPDLTSLFHEAAESGDTDTVRRLLKDGVDVNEKRWGQTALMLAAEYGHTDTVQALAALGADLHVKDTFCGRTALMLAAVRGHTDTVQALTALGADLHVRDTILGRTALVLAAERGHTDTVQALAALGADMHVKNEYGQTALMWAAERGRTDTVQALAALGADIHTKDRNGRTALLLAAEYGCTDTVQALATLGADIHIKSEFGRTALMWAAEYGRTDTMQALAALGADLHVKDTIHGQTALVLAAKSGHTDTVQALAALGADMHVKNEHGQTALMLAAEDGHTDTVQALAALGADIHTKDERGWTALLLAAECGHTDTVQALEALGADIHVKDRFGQTAQMVLAEHRRTHAMIPSPIEEQSSSSYSEKHHPPRLSPALRSSYLPSSDSGLRSTTTDEFSSEKEESSLKYSESGKGRRASQPGEKELTKAKTAKHCGIC